MLGNGHPHIHASGRRGPRRPRPPPDRVRALAVRVGVGLWILWHRPHLRQASESPEGGGRAAHLVTNGAGRARCPCGSRQPCQLCRRAACVAAAAARGTRLDGMRGSGAPDGLPPALHKRHQLPRLDVAPLLKQRHGPEAGAQREMGWGERRRGDGQRTTSFTGEGRGRQTERRRRRRWEAAAAAVAPCHHRPPTGRMSPPAAR